MVLRALVILVLIAQLLDRNYENVFLCALTLMLFTIPSVVEIRMDIDIRWECRPSLCFLSSRRILGEINKYYLIFPYWDTMLHTLTDFWQPPLAWP